jgi:hypothetical protein
MRKRDNASVSEICSQIFDGNPWGQGRILAFLLAEEFQLTSLELSSRAIWSDNEVLYRAQTIFPRCVVHFPVRTKLALPRGQCCATVAYS